MLAVSTTFDAFGCNEPPETPVPPPEEDLKTVDFYLNLYYDMRVRVFRGHVASMSHNAAIIKPNNLAAILNLKERLEKCTRDYEEGDTVAEALGLAAPDLAEDGGGSDGGDMDMDDPPPPEAAVAAASPKKTVFRAPLQQLPDAKAVGIEVQTVAFFLFHGLKNDLELGRPRTVSIETLRNLQAEFAEKFPPHHDEFPRLTSYEQVQGILAEVMAERDLFRVLRFAWRFVCQVESYRHRVKGERSCCHRDLIAMDAFLKAAFVEYTARGMTHWDPPPHLAPVIREAADAGLFGESDSE